MKFKMKAEFNVEFHHDDTRYLKVDVLNLTPEKLTSLEQLNYTKEEIEQWDFVQEDVEGIVINLLNEEKLYTGVFDVTIESNASYDSWTGVTEYDLIIFLKCSTYTESRDVELSAHYNPQYSKIFHVSGNKDGDYVYMKRLPSGRIHLDFAHCCVSYRGQFIDVTTLTACLAEHLHEYREKKSS